MTKRELEKYFSEELCRCPMCGKQPHLQTNKIMARVVCRCGVKTTYFMRVGKLMEAVAKAIKVWNRRTK